MRWGCSFFHVCMHGTPQKNEPRDPRQENLPTVCCTMWFDKTEVLSRRTRGTPADIRTHLLPACSFPSRLRPARPNASPSFCREGLVKQPNLTPPLSALPPSCARHLSPHVFLVSRCPLTLDVDHPSLPLDPRCRSSLIPPQQHLCGAELRVTCWCANRDVSGEKEGWMCRVVVRPGRAGVVADDIERGRFCAGIFMRRTGWRGKEHRKTRRIHSRSSLATSREQHDDGSRNNVHLAAESRTESGLGTNSPKATITSKMSTL